MDINQTTQARPRPRSRIAGFTLLEVMMAMGIFVIGFTMIMAVFPAAILLQKRTIDDVQSRNVAWNARAILNARPLNQANLVGAGGLTAGFDTNQQVHSLPAVMLPETGIGALQTWTWSDRSYPADIAEAPRRRVYWVPMVQDDNPATSAYDWRVFVFVLRRGEGLTYDKPVPADWANPYDPSGLPSGVGGIPGVRQLALDGTTLSTLEFDNDPDGNEQPDFVRVGDWVLDSNGVIYTITEVDMTIGSNNVTVAGLIPAPPAAPTSIWIGMPSSDGGTSPCQRIILISGVVQ
jgi:type II secretory pathway pseudopilin PulG